MFYTVIADSRYMINQFYYIYISLHVSSCVHPCSERFMMLKDQWALHTDSSTLDEGYQV